MIVNEWLRQAPCGMSCHSVARAHDVLVIFGVSFRKVVDQTLISE